MLQRVYRLREEIATFLEQKNINAAEFRDKKWVCSLAFLVDATSHLNKLNRQLQGKQQLIHKMWSKIRAFTTKLRLCEGQLESGNYAHFPTLQENKPTSNTPFVSAIRNLKTEFLSRFGDICSLENIKLFRTPFDVQVDTVQEKYQMKLVDLQCSDHQNSTSRVYYCLIFIKNIWNANNTPT